MKELLKTFAGRAAVPVVLPAALLFWLGRSVVGADRVFPGWSQAFALIPGLTGVYLRRAFYQLVLPRCEPGCFISFGTVISHSTAQIGRNVYVGVYGCLGDVTLEDDVLLGSHVSVMNGGGQHGIGRLDLPIRDQPGTFPRVTIGRDSWIGDRSVVLADVGCHCVIGAGSVVTRPIPDCAIALGNPARVIRFRNRRLDSSQASPTDRDAAAIPPAV